MSCNSDCVKVRLCPCALGFTFGILKGVCLLVLAWVVWLWGYGAPMMEHISQFYYGYSPSFVGGLIGAGWGFVGGFIFGFIFAFIYNFCLQRCCRKEAKSPESK